MENCPLCNNQLNESGFVTVRKKGVETLIKSSQLREDNKYHEFENKNSLKVHIKCRKDYTRNNSIAAYLTTKNSTESVDKKSLRSETERFDFKNKCLFCNKQSFLNRTKSKVSLVRTIEIKDTIMKYCEQRNDEWGKQVLIRISSELDLVAAEARYHPKCYASFTHIHVKDVTGRPVDEENLNTFFKLCEYLDQTKNEICQYPFIEIFTKFEELSPKGNDIWSKIYLKRKLKEHYKDELIFIGSPGMPDHVCFKGTNNVVNNFNFTNSPAERRQIIEISANILKEEIRSKFFVLDKYPTPQDIASGGSENIPDLLLRFLTILTGKEINNKKILSIANCLMASVRPRSYFSPVLFAVSVFIHRKFGSKNLIDLLSGLGFSETYNELRKFESTAAQLYDFKISESAFQQFVFDNADYNIKTLDGYGTFHNMGGIICVSPDNGFLSPESISRPTKVTKFERGRFADIPIIPYKKEGLGLKGVTLQPIRDIISEQVKQDIQMKNCLWMSGFLFNLEKTPSWNGYMAAKTTGTFETTKVVALPFINLEPSNLTTINSALLFASDMCRKQGLSICVVTFDQPLFIKASEIVASSGPNSSLKNVFVRLGGFHLLMSFLGAAGYIMGGSGLEELWNTVYAKNSIPAMTNGHSYARSLRAHFLTQLALSLLLLQEYKSTFTDEEINKIEDMHLSINNCDNALVSRICTEIKGKLMSQSQKRRTSKLWCEYWKLVDLMQLFIYAERTGTFDLHLQCVKDMIPYFHASGHLLYAKSSHLYLQQMEHLKEQATKEEYEKFLKYFAIRRSSTKYWSGVWSDMTIEQVLMRALKSEGGLTRGRGLKDATIAKWVLTMPQSTKICHALEELVGTHSVYSEQHIELSVSREKRDRKDLETFINWLKEHNPFDVEGSQLVSLSTGLVADETINCDNAKEIGENILNKLHGKNFSDLRLKRNDKVKTQAFMNKTLKVYDQVLPVNPTQLFNRIICTYKTEKSLKECFCYELAPYPLTLFENGMLRKLNKSSLAVILDKKCTPETGLPNNSRFVIDGGHLLHKVVWQSPATYSEVFDQYVRYVIYNYRSDAIVVFDGYNNSLSTKTYEHARRYKLSVPEIIFNESKVISTNQEKFLSNSNNKKRFIEVLSKKFQDAGIKVIQAKGDADVDIVNTVLSVSKTHLPVTLVGDDTDLLVLLIHYTKNKGIYMMRPGKVNKPNKLTDIYDIKEHLEDISNCILFLHAISGCDTTSSIYKKGKLACFQVLKKNKRLHQEALKFYDNNSSRQEIIKAGESFLSYLYGGTHSTSLNELRYSRFKQVTARQGLNKNFELACLPPTIDAAKYHIFRVFLQVQEWLGNSLNPTAWGWKAKDSILYPETTNKPIAPDFILKIIFCNCKNGCKKMCSCRRSNIFCTSFCGSCSGNACENSQIVDDDDDNDAGTNDVL